MAQPPRITLLSSSARRREILSRSFDNIEIDDSRGDEPRPSALEPVDDYVVRSAVSKLGGPPWRRTEGHLISADTVVVLDNEILGKPVSEVDARCMLRRLSDTWHRVVTGVAILDSATGRSRHAVETSHVRTRHFSDQEIEAYISSGEPFDKAGAYAVQDNRFKPVVTVRGCYLNVVGLPLCLVSTLLHELSAAARLRDLNSVPYYNDCRDCKLDTTSEDLS